jgi:hypothetical protein
MEMNSTPAYVIEQEDDDLNCETITVSSGPPAATAQHEDIQHAVDSFESALQHTRSHARQVVCTEAARVNKRLMQLQKEQPRKKQRQSLTTEESREQEVLLHQMARSRKMMQLLERLEQVQEQLSDEMNACADDADFRGD